MDFLKQVFIVGLMWFAICGVSQAVLIDQFTGDYWYDWIGNQPAGEDPGTEVGTTVITPNSVNLTYHSSWDVGEQTFGFNFTNPSLDADGYLTMQTIDGPTQVVANGHYISRLTDGTTDDPLSHGFMVRKAVNPTVDDIVGDYAFVRYAMHGDPGNPLEETEGAFGTVSLSTGDPDNEWSAQFTILNSYGLGTGTNSGTWTSDSANSLFRLSETGVDGFMEMKVGTGGIVTNTIIDTEDTLARLVMVKKGTGRTIAEVVGHYTLQGFSSSIAGDEFWTTWGSLDVLADGSWTATTSSSTGAVGEISTGMCSVDDDGTLHITDTTGLPIEGVISLDGDLLVLSTMNLSNENPVEGDVGIMFAVRPIEVPEPSSLILLFLGLLGLFIFRLRR